MVFENIFTLLFLYSCKVKQFTKLKLLFCRSVGKTHMNEQSSRSHFVFTLRISGVNEVNIFCLSGLFLCCRFISHL